MTDLPSKDKPPHNVNVLNRWLTEASQQSGIEVGRLRRWIGFMVVAAMLDRVRHADDGEPLFLIKGGVAMELRLSSDARATKDLDTTLRAAIDEVTDHLDPVLRQGFGDFTATRTEVEAVRDTGAVRFDIKLSYRGRSVGTVPVEASRSARRRFRPECYDSSMAFGKSVACRAAASTESMNRSAMPETRASYQACAATISAVGSG